MKIKPTLERGKWIQRILLSNIGNINYNIKKPEHFSTTPVAHFKGFKHKVSYFWKAKYGDKKHKIARGKEPDILKMMRT